MPVTSDVISYQWKVYSGETVFGGVLREIYHEHNEQPILKTKGEVGAVGKAITFKERVPPLPSLISWPCSLSI